MTKEQFFIGVSVCMSAFALCTATQNVAPQDKTAPIANAENIWPSISEIRTTLDTLKTNFDLLNNDYNQHTNPDFAFIKPTDTGFYMVRTDYGNILVSLKNVEKFGNGYRLICDFGNPTSMALSGLNGTIRWGKRPFTDDQHKKDFQILSVLQPGAWNEVPITIGPAGEEDIGVFVIGDLKTNTVRMRTVYLPN